MDQATRCRFLSAFLVPRFLRYSGGNLVRPDVTFFLPGLHIIYDGLESLLASVGLVHAGQPENSKKGGPKVTPWNLPSQPPSVIRKDDLCMIASGNSLGTGRLIGAVIPSGTHPRTATTDKQTPTHKSY